MPRDRTILDWLLLPLDVVLAYGGVAFILLLGFGIPLVVFTFMWTVVLGFVHWLVDYPTVTVGFFDALDLPAAMYGVPLLYGFVPGILTTLYLSRNWVSKAEE